MWEWDQLPISLTSIILDCIMCNVPLCSNVKAAASSGSATNDRSYGTCSTIHPDVDGRLVVAWCAACGFLVCECWSAHGSNAVF